MPVNSWPRWFELLHVFRAAPVARRVAESGARESPDAFPGHFDFRRPPAEAEDVHIIVLHLLSAARAPLTSLAATEAPTPLPHSKTPHSTYPVANARASGIAKVGIVVIGIVNHVHKSDHLMSFLRQLSGELHFHRKTAVIGRRDRFLYLLF